MKKTLLFALLCWIYLTVVSVKAEPLTTSTRITHSVQSGIGICWEGGHSNWESYIGPIIVLNYRIDIPLSSCWSLCPGFGANTGMTGYAAYNPFTSLQACCSVAYHYLTYDVPMFVSVGPALSYMVIPMRYHYSDGGNHPLNGKEVYKRALMSIRSEITFCNSNHWHWGLTGEIGLGNAIKHYPGIDTPQASLYSLQFNVNYSF